MDEFSGTVTGRWSGSVPNMEEVPKPVELQSWDQEPDLKWFSHRGLKCVILRAMPMGHLCGYVKLPPGVLLKAAKKEHRKVVTPSRDKSLPKSFRKVLRKSGYGAPELRLLNVHGGLTFCGKYRGMHRMSRGIWVGFDCAHYGDLMPMPYVLFKGSQKIGAYRTMEYVELEVMGLVDQILDLEAWL